ncbi:MAG: pyroglutamyl-peptidase I [Clostridia bacterium]|nr:pyroglutamyl-peptidase I [Clostridia bacterium]
MYYNQEVIGLNVLITAFEPFGGERTNSSLELLKTLTNQNKLILPVSYLRAPKLCAQAVREAAPDALICLGQARGRLKIMQERVAINVADSSVADNDGVLLRDAFLDAHGAAAYFSTLQLALDVSYHAGTFVCNALLYAMLRDFPELRCTFVHIPAENDMPTDEARAVIEKAIAI